MGYRLRIFLTNEEKRTLSELRKAAGVPQRTKDRAHVLLLNAGSWKIPQIANCFNWAESTVRQTLQRWQNRGLVGLWDRSGRGVKQRWQESDLAYLEHCLEQEPRTYNSQQLAQKLQQERQVYLSPDRIRRVLKKRGEFGNAQELVIKASKIPQTKV